MKRQLLFIVACFLSAANGFAQDTIPTLTIDSTLVVGDSASIGGSFRVEGETNLRSDATASRDFTVDGNAYFNGTIFYPGAQDFEGDFEDKGILVFNPLTGAVEKSTKDILYAHIYSKHCEAVGGVVQNPMWNNGPNKLYVACPEVKVGIGTQDPSHNLHVVGNTLTQGTAQVNTSFAIGTDPSGFSRFKVRNNAAPAAIEVDQTGNTTAYNKLLFLQFDDPQTEILKVVNTQTGHVPYFFESSGRFTVHNGEREIMQLDPDGMLHTRGLVMDELEDTWPDFVFEPGYDLRPLSEVKTCIASDGHLPGVPSAEEIEATGLNVSEMNRILLQKVEELTLYILQQEERISKLEAELKQK